MVMMPAREVEMEYLVIFQKAEHNYAAYVPELPGCVSTGETREEVEANIREAIEFHLDGLREMGEPIPEPTHAWTGVVRVA